MMKYFALAGLVTLASIPAANATIADRPCGGTGTYAQAGTISNDGITDVAYGGLGSGGYARQFVHRNCGQITLYIYTGTSTGNDTLIDVHLDPELVDYDEAQAKCVTSFATTSPVYQEEGYSVILQPTGYNLTLRGDIQRESNSGLHANDANFYSNATHAVVPLEVWGSANLPANSEFVINLNCGQVHRPGGPSGG